MASTNDWGSLSICLVSAAMTPAQLLPRPSITVQPPVAPIAPPDPLDTTGGDSRCTSTSPLFLRSSSRLKLATASQATARSRFPLAQTAPRTPTMSGLMRANSSRSCSFRWPEREVLRPSSLPWSTISFSSASGMKSNRLRPSLVSVSIRKPSHSPSLASWTISLGSSPPS